MEAIEFEFCTSQARDAFLKAFRGLRNSSTPGYYYTSEHTIDIGVHCNKVTVYYDETKEARKCAVCEIPDCRYEFRLIEHHDDKQIPHDMMYLCTQHAPSVAICADTHVGKIEIFGRDETDDAGERGGPSDAATATGMYDHDDSN